MIRVHTCIPSTNGFATLVATTQGVNKVRDQAADVGMTVYVGTREHTAVMMTQILEF